VKPLLKTHALEIRTQDAQLVEPLSLEVRAGEVLTIIGETGSGKSLFAQGIVGNLPPGLHAQGTIEFGDGLCEDGRASGRHRLWGKDIAVLPQEPWLSLNPTMRANAQVAESHHYVAGKPWATARAAARQALDELGLGRAAQRYPFELSGGMAQRLAFAATHAGGAKLMIADEPTKGLDRDRIGEIISLLQAGLATGGALLIITHDIALARRLGGQVMIMLKGKVVERGSAEDVLERPTHAYTRRLIDADPSRWPRPPRPPSQADTVLKVRDLAAQRGGRTLFEGVSFEVRGGEIVGVTGPSGCGKSSLGDVLLSLLPASAGSVVRPVDASRVAFQKLYQDPVAAFPATLTLARNLADLVRLHRLDASGIPTLMQRLRLEPALLERLPGQVSGGELQRFSLLRVLLLKPLFIFADEPSSRLDLITQQEMIELLVEAAREHHTAVLLVSHDQALIEAVCDQRIALGDTTPACEQASALAHPTHATAHA
jgi:peptide/nickel transport system ATP-binding protein